MSDILELRVPSDEELDLDSDAFSDTFSVISDAARLDAVRHDVTRVDAVRTDATRHDAIRVGSARPGATRPAVARQTASRRNGSRTNISRKPVFPKSSGRHRQRTLRQRIHPWKLPTFKKSLQVFNHMLGMMVLCFRESGYCLTDGITSYVRENDPDMERSLLFQLSEMNVTKLYVPDEASYLRWNTFRRSLNKTHRLCTLNAKNLKVDAGICPACNKNCMRWVAISALNSLRKCNVDPIPHVPST